MLGDGPAVRSVGAIGSFDRVVAIRDRPLVFVVW